MTMFLEGAAYKISWICKLQNLCFFENFVVGTWNYSVPSIMISTWKHFKALDFKIMFLENSEHMGFWNTSWTFSVIITHNKTTIGQKVKVLGIIYYFCFDNFFRWALKFWLVLTRRPHGISMESRPEGKSRRGYFLTWLLFYFGDQAEVQCCSDYFVGHSCWEISSLHLHC